MKWERRFLSVAKGKAEWSKDPSTKVGAVAVRDRREVAHGFNGFPERTNDAEELYLDRDAKILRTVHAEANLVAQAAKYGIALEGTTVYVTFHPCSQCAGLLINAGVKEIYYVADLPIPDRWRPNMDEAARLLREAGVQLRGI